MDFDFGEDFEVDTGISLDIEGYNNDDDAVTSGNTDGRDDIKRTAILAIIAGVIIIIIAFSIIGIANKIKGNNKNDTRIEETVNEEKGIVGDTNIENKMPINANVKDNMEGDWVSFKKDESLKLNKSVEALFTVTSIQHLAKIVNNKNDKIIKSILKGNISGITGTYEIEVPYEKAKLLDDGTVFTIKYKYTIKNGTRIVGGIEY